MGMDIVGLPRLPSLPYQKKGLPGLPGLEDAARPRRLPALRADIPLRPRMPGQREDKLERAAIQDPRLTLPERIVYAWLLKRGYLFQAQESVAGGRLLPGGAVVDFIVYDMAARPVAIRVQGDYWHGPQFPGRMARDDEQAIRLRQMGYIPVDLWESEIYQAAEHDRLDDFIEGSVLGAMG